MDSHVFRINSNAFQLELIPLNVELIQLKYTPDSGNFSAHKKLVHLQNISLTHCEFKEN